LSLYDKYRNNKTADSEDIKDDIIFEIELVKSVEVNIDYILMLVTKLHSENCQNKEIEANISNAIDSSPTLRNKKDLIISFVESLTVGNAVTDEWKKFIEDSRDKELNIIVDEEKLDKDKTIQFIQEAFRNGELNGKGTDIVKILPPISMFDKNGVNRSEKKKSVIKKLFDFFNRFIGL
jgi:type I restriction enzyme R subunit